MKKGAKISKTKLIILGFVLFKAQLFSQTISSLSIDAINGDILKLDYDKARQKAMLLLDIDSLKNKALLPIVEISFWYSETGNYKAAKKILETTVKSLNSNNLKGLSKKIKRLNGNDGKDFTRFYKEFDNDFYQFLLKRYYPEIIEIEGGEFFLGCESNDKYGCNPDEEGFLSKVGNYGISKTEITYWQWGLFCEATGNKQWFRSPYYGVFGDRPAVLVYWDAAIEYCNWMNSKYSNFNSITRGETIGDSDESIEINSPSRRKVIHYKIDIEKKGFRLPTEREWEYAAKGGINHDKYNFCGSNTVDSVAWYKDNADYVAQPVATKRPNSLGIYDMCGNALEWCLEWRFPYNTDRETINAYYPSRGRICRGGGCGFAPRACQVHSRNAVLAYLTEPILGFRVVKKK